MIRRQKTDTVHHMFQSAFTQACSTLWELEIADGLLRKNNQTTTIPFEQLSSSGSGEPRPYPAFFAIKPEAGIREILSGCSLGEKVSAVKLISSYLLVACDYGEQNSYMPTRRSPFSPQAQYKMEIEALAYHGFADRVGSEFAWNDKIGDAMRAAAFWNTDNHCRGQIEEERLEAEARLACRSMPETVRHAYFSKHPVALLPIVRLLARAWHDDRWSFDDNSERITLRGNPKLARRIVEIASGRA